jgi:hypothetical protein
MVAAARTRHEPDLPATPSHAESAEHFSFDFAQQVQFEMRIIILYNFLTS